MFSYYRSLSSEEFCNGLAALRVHPKILLSSEDFDEITASGTLCNSHGELGLFEFRQVGVCVCVHVWMHRHVCLCT